MQMKESDKMERGRMHARKNERNAFYRNQKVVRVIATHRPTGSAPMGGCARGMHPWGRKLRARLGRVARGITSLEHADIEYDRDCTAPIFSRLSAYWWPFIRAEITLRDKLMLHTQVYYTNGLHPRQDSNEWKRFYIDFLVKIKKKITLI